MEMIMFLVRNNRLFVVGWIR